MPVLVNYGTYDTAMPIGQGRSGSSPRPTSPATRTSPYAISPATIRCGLVEGLFTPNLPLAEGYTQALENWVNGVTAGTKADGWATPQVAGATPHQRFAAPQRTRSGIVGSLGVLAGLMVAGPVLIVMAAILGIGLTVFSWLQTLLVGRRRLWRLCGPCMRRRVSWGPPSGACCTALPGLSAGIGTAVMVITGLLYGYMKGAVGVSAVLVMPSTAAVCRRMGGAANSDHAVGGAVCLGNGTCLVLPRRYRRCAARHIVMVALGTLATLMTTGILGPILAVILPMCAGKWGLAGRLRWWSGCGAIGRLRWPGYGRPTYISRGVRIHSEWLKLLRLGGFGLL